MTTESNILSDIREEVFNHFRAGSANRREELEIYLTERGWLEFRYELMRECPGCDIEQFALDFDKMGVASAGKYQGSEVFVSTKTRGALFVVVPKDSEVFLRLAHG